MVLKVLENSQHRAPRPDESEPCVAGRGWRPPRPSGAEGKKCSEHPSSHCSRSIICSYANKAAHVTQRYKEYFYSFIFIDLYLNK